MLVTACFRDRYRGEYGELRWSFLHSPEIRLQTTTMCDRWDRHGVSQYLDLRIGGKLVGTARLTRGCSNNSERGVIQNWIGKHDELPWGVHVLDATRFVNAPEVQGLGFYGIEFLLVLHQAEQMGGITDICAVVKEDLLIPYQTLLRIGFEEMRGEAPYVSEDVAGQRVPVKFMRHNLALKTQQRAKAWAHSASKLRRFNIRFPLFERLHHERSLAPVG